MRRATCFAVLLAVALWGASLAASEDADAKRTCASVAPRYPDGTEYNRTGRIIAVNVGCRKARRVVLRYLEAEGTAGPKPRPFGFRCRPTRTGGRCKKGIRIVMWRYRQSGRVVATRRCPGFRAPGQSRSPVRVENMACRRGRRIARRLAINGRLPRGWTARNPAGCEWVIFRRRDRRAIVNNGYRPPGDQPVIYTAFDRGCNS